MSGAAEPGVIVGVISDTHGQLDPRVVDAFEGVSRVIHAGDIGSADVLARLETIAPVTAVLGNTDGEFPGCALSYIEDLSIGGLMVRVVHDASTRRCSAAPAGTAVVISGHTHVPTIRTSGGVLCLNPGAAYRSRLPGAVRTVGLLEIRDRRATARIIYL